MSDDGAKVLYDDEGKPYIELKMKVKRKKSKKQKSKDRKKFHAGEAFSPRFPSPTQHVDSGFRAPHSIPSASATQTPGKSNLYTQVSPCIQSLLLKICIQKIMPHNNMV